MSWPYGAYLPLRAGASGQAVIDLQGRLTSIGFSTQPDPPGSFDKGTQAAVEAFQQRRGLRVDGIVGPQTWSALVEASFTLGDRVLYLRTPMLRGDDVAELQKRLCSLGFDTGRVDGIFGPLTAAGLSAFQRDIGLPADGILGATTLHELLRVAPRYGHGELVSAVREREMLRSHQRTLSGMHVALGEEGGLDVLLSGIRRQLVGAGAKVLSVLHHAGSAQAAAANNANVDVFVGFRLNPHEEGAAAAYYSGYSYESPGGKRLAELIELSVSQAVGVPARGTHGMTLTVLRETRMPAVVCELGPAYLVVRHAAGIALGVVKALSQWSTSPIEEGGVPGKD